jgi:hypothetical protein
MSVLPTSRSELAAMFACYLLTALLGAMALFPRECAQLLIGVLK